MSEWIWTAGRPPATVTKWKLNAWRRAALMLHPLRPPLIHRKSDPGAARQGKEGLGTINGFPPTPRPTMPISRTILTLSLSLSLSLSTPPVCRYVCAFPEWCEGGKASHDRFEKESIHTESSERCKKIEGISYANRRSDEKQCECEGWL